MTTQIEAHEQALGELLERVFQSPLKPLRDDLQVLRTDLQATQTLITKTTRTLQMEVEETHEAVETVQSTLRSQSLALQSLQERLSKLEALEKIDAAADRLSAELATASAGLATQLDTTRAAIVQNHEHHANEHRNMVSTALRQPLEQQLTALQKRVHWLAPLCAISLASTLGVLVLLALR